MTYWVHKPISSAQTQPAISVAAVSSSHVSSDDAVAPSQPISVTLNDVQVSHVALSEANVPASVSDGPVVLPVTAIEVASDLAPEHIAAPEKKSSVTSSGSPEAYFQPTQPIDLTTALLLTTGQNPRIAFAKARIEEALAQVDRANALKLPSLRAGINYNKHEGRIQDVAGTIIETSRGSMYTGLGANAVGAGPPAIPGIVSQFHFADAIFQPKIAQRTACARQSQATAVTNDQLLATAVAYTELLRAEQDVVVLHQVVEFAGELQQTTQEFELAGQGLSSDYDRARVEFALRQTELVRAEEVANVAAARLSELVRWDSAQRLVPVERNLYPIELSQPEAPPQELVALALTNRPELAQSRHLVGEAVERLRREQHAPLVPSVLLAASYGGLGGGLGSDLVNWGDRIDADAVAFWEVRQFGLGEQAAKREARARIAQARQQELAAMDQIAREVNETYAQVQSRKRQLLMMESAVVAAEDSFEKNWERIRNGQGLPIETLQSIQALATARREYVRVVADYNIAQFSLHRALGWPVH